MEQYCQEIRNCIERYKERLSEAEKTLRTLRVKISMASDRTEREILNRKRRLTKIFCNLLRNKIYMEELSLGSD